MKGNLPENTWEQLCWLRDITKRTGIIHHSQALQMKVWPRLLFEKCSSSEASVDVDNKSVVYDIELKTSEPGLDKAASHLTSYTKRLLGTDWSVLVQVKAPDQEQALTFTGEAND